MQRLGREARVRTHQPHTLPTLHSQGWGIVVVWEGTTPCTWRLAFPALPDSQSCCCSNASAQTLRRGPVVRPAHDATRVRHMYLWWLVRWCLPLGPRAPRRGCQGGADTLAHKGLSRAHPQCKVQNLRPQAKRGNLAAMTDR